MALTHLVDTSVLTRLGEPTVRAALESLAAVGRVGRSGISDLEVGYSARSAREWDDLQTALSAFELVETEARHMKRARQVQRMLAGRSQRGRKVPDLLVAATAEEAGFDRSALRRRLRSHRRGDRTEMRMGSGSRQHRLS